MSKPGFHHRVFVVDDEHVIASTLALILRQEGYEATPFTAPLEALQAINSAPPDLLISDVVMPLLSGIDLAVQVRERYPNCRVLLFSGQANNEDLLEDAKSRGHDFELLAKPVHPKDLLSKIRSVIAFPPPPPPPLRSDSGIQAIS